MAKTTLLAIVLIITGAVYANSLYGSLQFDDFAIAQWLDGGMSPYVAHEMGIPHRPLPYFTYWLNYRMGGGDPFIYHLTNLAVHLIAVGLVLFLVEHLLASTYAAAFGALLFGIHPFFSSSVAYIYARGSMMAAVFVFAAALAALKLRGWWPWIVTPGLLALGVLSKEEAMIAPALFLGYAFIQGHKAAAKLLGVAMVLGLIAIMFMAPQVQTIANTSLTDDIRPVSDLILNYGSWPLVENHLRGVLSGYVFHTLGNLLLPVHLTPDPAMVFDRRWIAALVVIALMAGFALSKRIAADIRMALWALLCCPILGALVVLVAEPLFEYRAYILGLGVALTGGVLFLRLQRARPAPVLAALMLCLLAAGTIQRNQTWSTVVGLWTDANQKDPEKKRAVLNLSAALLKEKRDLEAERVLTESLKIHPAFRAAHINLAAVYIENHRCDVGEYHARFGVPVPLAYTYIALCQAGRGDLPNALTNAESAVALDPEMIYARSVRQGIIKEMGRSSEELTTLEARVAEKPKDRMAHAELSIAYRMAGYIPGADEQAKISEQLAKEN